MEYRFAFIFSKTKDMIYISHLDLLRLFGRVLRRAGLPVALTHGFSPRLKVKLKRALKLGVASEAEEGEMVLTEKIEGSEIKERINEQLPDGMDLKDISFLEELKT